MQGGMPILAFIAKLSVANGGDGKVHYWTAAYPNIGAINTPVQVDVEVGAVDVSMFYPPEIGHVGSVVVVAYTHPTGPTLNFRTSTDSGVTWSAPFTPASMVGQVPKNDWAQFYLDGSTLYYFYERNANSGLRYITSTDGVTWSSETVTNIAFDSGQSNEGYGSRKFRILRNQSGQWFMFFQGSFKDAECSPGNVSATPDTWPAGTGQFSNCGAVLTHQVEFSDDNTAKPLGSLLMETDNTTVMAVYGHSSTARFCHKTSVDSGVSWQPFGGCYNQSHGVLDSPDAGVSYGLGVMAVMVVNGVYQGWAAESSISVGSFGVGPTIKTCLVADTSLNPLNIYTVLGSADTSFDTVCVSACCPAPANLAAAPARPTTYVIAGSSAASRLTPQGDAIEIKSDTGAGRLQSKPDQGSARLNR